jgi:hypothetical protein
MKIKNLLWGALGLVLFGMILIALAISNPGPETSPFAVEGVQRQLLLALTRTRQALNSTATYLATYPRPQPTTTYYGECMMGVTYVCTAEAVRKFDEEATRFQYEATHVT